MLGWINSAKIYLILAAALVAFIGIWGEIRKADGVRQQLERTNSERVQREEVTRERGRQANEDIRSGGNDFISNWLRDNNRFRD